MRTITEIVINENPILQIKEVVVPKSNKLLSEIVGAKLAELRVQKDAADPFIADAVKDALTSAARLIDPMLNVSISTNEEFATFWTAFQAMTPMDFYKRGAAAGYIDGIVSGQRHRAEIKAHEAKVAAEVPEPQKGEAE